MEYPLSVCVAGSTGLVGQELLALLEKIDMVKEVKALSRRPIGKLPAKTENFIVNFDQLLAQKTALKAQVFICCLGSTIKQAGSEEAFRKVDYDFVVNFAKLAESVGADKFLVVSAMGANSKSSYFYNRVKGEMEETLYKLNIPQIEIFRPSLILGERKHKRPGENFGKMLSPLLKPLLVGPLKKYRAIKASDIAKALALAAVSFEAGRYCYESDELQSMADSIVPDKD